MALTDAEVARIAGHLADRIFVTPRVTAHSSTTKLKAAIQALDGAMEATVTQIYNNVPDPGRKLKLVLLDQVQDVSANFTNEQAAIALALWAMNEVGLL